MFDLVEVNRLVQFVLADKVDLLFAFSVPPRSHLRIRRLLGKLPVEEAFKRIPAEHIEVPRRNLTKLVVTFELQDPAVFEDKPEPEPEKAVVDLIMAILARLLFKEPES